MSKSGGISFTVCDESHDIEDILRYFVGREESPDAQYKKLRQILDRAYDQAAAGKGAERHANDLPFEEQPILAETRAVGIGFVAGQARKKVLEATRCWEDHPERAVADLLGAINYIAAQIIYIEERKIS